MSASVSRPTTTALVPDGVAVIGLVAAGAIVVLLVTLLFAVIRRFARQDNPGFAAPVATTHLPTGR